MAKSTRRETADRGRGRVRRSRRPRSRRRPRAANDQNPDRADRRGRPGHERYALSLGQGSKLVAVAGYLRWTAGAIEGELGQGYLHHARLSRSAGAARRGRDHHWTPDHWHRQITIDALNAGKGVYCEKPMVQLLTDGKDVIDAAKKPGKIFQAGSQRVSSVVYQKAQGSARPWRDR